MTIQLGKCPICGSDLTSLEMRPEMTLVIPLNDGTELHQPVCQRDRHLLERFEFQRTLMDHLRPFWIREIIESDKLGIEEKQAEITRINTLEATARGTHPEPSAIAA